MVGAFEEQTTPVLFEVAHERAPLHALTFKGSRRLEELGLVAEFEAARAAKNIEEIEQILLRARVDRASIQAMVEAL